MNLLDVTLHLLGNMGTCTFEQQQLLCLAPHLTKCYFDTSLCQVAFAVFMVVLAVGTGESAVNSQCQPKTGGVL